jgi:hypothetical protein
MKKKLEADLISIAHRILKLKNKSELDQLYLETQQLYEKLAVLKFVESHFADAKPTIGHQEVTEALQVVFDQETETPEPETIADKPAVEAEEVKVQETAEEEAVAAPETTEQESEAVDEEHETEEVAEVPEGEEETTVSEEEPEEESPEESEAGNTAETEETSTKEEANFKPSFDLSFEKKEEEVKEMPKQISFEDFLGNYTEPIFEKVSDKKEEPAAETPEPDPSDSEQAKQSEEVEEPTAEQPEEEEAPESDSSDSEQAKQTKETVEEEEPEEEEEGTPAEEAKQPEPEPYKAETPVEKTSRSITFGLNDRVGFEKHLFGGSSEDMNRVVSQLSTFDSFEEARDFIEDMVKPDYNNWEGKDDYAQRFIDIVERKFN